MVIKLKFLLLILLGIFCSVRSVLLTFQEEIGFQQAPMKTALKLDQSFKSRFMWQNQFHLSFLLQRKQLKLKQ